MRKPSPQTPKRSISLGILALTAILVLQSKLAWAHVKWFSDFSFADKPKTLAEVMDATFWGLMALSIFCIGLLAVLDFKFTNLRWTQKLTTWLEKHKNYSTTVMRAAAAAVLLLSFQSGALFVPELSSGSEALGWIQFTLALLLLFNRTVIISGFGILALYVYGITQFGWFHMLDYVVFAGVGYYLIVTSLQDKKIKGTGLITLYVTVGFSLSWVAIEKLLYPQWGLYVLEQNPQLALGLDMKFFLTAAAFIEISLGYLLIICLLQRPLALVVTLTFFLTTLVFGKTEVIGHTILHAALIVFLIEGPGKIYPTPVAWHKTLALRVTFACINFIFLVFGLLLPYQKVATLKYETTVQKITTEAGVKITDRSAAPKVDLHLIEDETSGYALHIKTANFRFAPENTGRAHVPGEGHAHIFVNNKKAGRAYGPWYYLEAQGKGRHQVKVTLNTNDHRLFLLDGKPIEAEISLEVTDTAARKPSGHNH